MLALEAPMKERRVGSWRDLRLALVEDGTERIVVTDREMSANLAPIRIVHSNPGVIAGIVAILILCGISSQMTMNLVKLNVDAKVAAAVAVTIAFLGISGTIALLKDWKTLEFGPGKLVLTRGQQADGRG
jgi:cytochrome c biogenesis protein CcdA